MSSHLKIIADLEAVAETQARVIRVLVTRLAELGDVETGRDEIAEADRAYRRAIGEGGWDLEPGRNGRETDRGGTAE